MIKKIRELFIIPILLIGLYYSCSKNNEHNVFNTKKIDTIFEEYFVPKQFLKKSTENTEVLLMLVDSLRKINDNNTFAEQFINSFGVPDFLNSDVFLINDNVTVFTPIVNNESVNSIIISSFLDNMFHYYVTTREYIPIPNLDVAQIIDTVNIENNQALFDAYEYQLFQNELVRFRFKKKYGAIDYNNKSFAELWNTKKVLNPGEGVCVEFYDDVNYTMMCEYGDESDNNQGSPGDNNDGGIGDDSNYDPNAGTGDTSGDSGSGSSSGDSVDNLLPTVVDSIKVTDIFQLKPCLKNIITTLQYKADHTGMIPNIRSMSNISNAILQLFDGSNDVNLVFDLGDLYGNGATTPYMKNGQIFITLDSDYCSKATKLAIARTIIHETIHAYLVKRYYEGGEIHTLLDLYRNDFNTPNLTHHNLTTDLVDAIAYSLSVYDNHRLDENYYYYLAWGGLHKTEEYKMLKKNNPSLITKIENALSAEQNNNNAKSTKCDESNKTPIE